MLICNKKDILLLHQKVISSFTNQLKENFDLNECECCHQMIRKVNICQIKYSEQFLKFKDLFPSDEIYICKDYCLPQMLKQDVPKYSKLYNMYLPNSPHEILK
jgi:hypothetical protein